MFSVSNVGLDISLFARLVMLWPPLRDPDGSFLWRTKDDGVVSILVEGPSGCVFPALSLRYTPFRMDAAAVIREIDAFNQQVALHTGHLRVAL